VSDETAIEASFDRRHIEFISLTAPHNRVDTLPFLAADNVLALSFEPPIADYFMQFALLALFLAAFSIGTTEFVVTGLIPAISADLGVSIPTAGILVSGYALGVAIGGPVLALFTSGFPRKSMILALMAIFVLGHVLCAMAPNYTLLMAARIVVSISHGTFFGLAAIVATTVVPKEKTGSALALVFAGITVANIIGVPAGTAIGNALGWRATFWIVGGVAVLAAIAIFVFVPQDHKDQKPRGSLAKQFSVLGNQKVLTSYALIILMMIGFWSLFTFVAPFLTQVSGIPSETVPWILLLFGAGATLGIFAGGKLSDRRPLPTILVTFPLQGVIFALMLVFGTNPYVMSVLVVLCGALGFLVGTPLQNRILTGAREAPDLASTLISSVFNIGIAIGAWIGATALGNGVAYENLPWFGLAFAIPNVVIAVYAVMMDRQELAAAKAA
jgi:DHA1 family inner membrane transport protein